MGLGAEKDAPRVCEPKCHAYGLGCACRTVESDALAGEVWQEADNVLLLCVIPNRVWQDFNGQRFRWDAPTIARPLRRLLDRAGNLAPEYGKTSVIPSEVTDE